MEGHTGSNGLIYRNPQVKNYGKVVQSRWLRLLLCALTGMIHAQSVLAQTVTAGPGQTVEETGLSIVTNGANGVVAQGGTLTLHNSSLTTSGSGVAGLALLSDNKFSSMLTTTSSTVTATGGAWGILIRGTTNRTAVNTITLESTEITTENANAIEAEDNMNVDITLTNGSQVIPGNGVLLQSFENGQRGVNLTAQGNVILQGDVLVEGPALVDVTLLDNSRLTGAMPTGDATSTSKRTCGHYRRHQHMEYDSQLYRRCAERESGS
jgi:hypothetical protein